MNDQDRIARLAPPAAPPIPMVLDTDTYNEIDDQFALVYALLSRNRLDVKAVYAAPFHNARSESAGDGMERSYEEILRLLERLGRAPDGFAFRGSESYLPDAETAVRSAAVEDLIARARGSRNGPLYVVAVGAVTNVASALLNAPDIAENIVVVWLGGHPTTWHTAFEFNLKQDIPAARVVFDSGAPVVHVPCKNVAEHARTTIPEMRENLPGRGRVGDYLFEIFCDYAPERPAWSKVLWDMVPVAWLVNCAWVPTVLRHSPVLNDGPTWSHDPRRHLVREAIDVNRDAVFADFFGKLQENAR